MNCRLRKLDLHELQPDREQNTVLLAASAENSMYILYAMPKDSAACDPSVLTITEKKRAASPQ